MRRSRTLFAVLLSFSLLAAACGGDDDSSTPTTTAPAKQSVLTTTTAAPATTAAPSGLDELNVAYFLEWPTANQVAQVEQTYDSVLGLTVNWIAFPSGNDMALAMESGDIDISYSQGLTPFANYVTSGADHVIVGVAVSYADADNCVAHPDYAVSQDNAASSLAGQAIYTPIGNVTHFKLLKMLEHLGVSLDDVSLIPSEGGPAAVAAFENGDVAMACAFGGAINTMLASGGNLVMTGSEQEALGIRVFDIISAPRSFAEEHGDVVTAFLQVTEDANAAYAADRASLETTIADAAGMDLAGTSSLLDAFTFLDSDSQLSEAWLGGTVQAAMKEQMDFFVAQGEIDTALDSYDAVVDTSYLEAVVGGGFGAANPKAPSDGEAAPVSALETPAEVTPACDATVPGSEIVYGPYYAGRGFDPPYSSGALVGGTELAAVYDTLIRYNPETAGFEPQLARDMTVNEDFTVWTLHLRDGITYDDGTPLDADMVVANHERFFTPTSEDRRIINTSPAFLQFIEETKVIDSLTVEYHLIQSWATFPFVLSDEPGFIINVNAVGDDPEAFNALPPAHAGVGAYTVEKNTPGEEIVFKARDNYWGGPVCVETLRFNMAAASALIGATGAYEAFQNGDLTTAFLRDSTAIAQAEADGAQMSMDYQDAGGIFYFNHGADSPTSDATLREAISLAIDIDVLNDRAHDGDMRVAKSVVVPGSPYYTDAVLEGATDAARAAELVAESGFSGTLRLLCGNRGSAVEIGLATEAMLEAVGLDVEINAQGTSAAIAEMIAGNYDVNCGGWNAGGATAISSYVRNLQSTSPSNRMGYESAEMDSLLSAALSADKADVPAALAAINNMIVTEWVSVPYGALPEGIVIADNLAGVKQTTSTIFLFDDAYFTE